MELVEQLQLREEELIKELSAIQTLIGVYNKNNTTTETTSIEEHPIVIDGNKIPPKGSMGWENYAILVLRRIGGKAKASEVTVAAVKANPNIDKKTIKSAIRAKLSIKYRDGNIDAIKGENKKDGYVYVLDPTKRIRTK